MEKTPSPIAVVHDGDPVASAVLDRLADSGVPARQVAAAHLDDELVGATLGSRALIAIGDPLVADPRVLRAAGLPGVGALVAVVSGDPDLSDLRRSGVPYTVLHRAPLLEELADALAPAIARGRLLLARGEDPRIAWVAAADVAACALAALDAEDCCGQVVDVAAPEPLAVGELAARLASTRGARLKVRTAPRWSLGPLRLLGRRPFELPGNLRRPGGGELPASLHPGSWLGVESRSAPRARTAAA